MHYQTTRTLARRGHIAIAVFQCAYIYTPLHLWSHGLTVVQWVTFPLLVVSGTWLHSGGKLWRRLMSGKGRRQHPAPCPCADDTEEAQKMAS